ncbi:MAG: tetratricopeptide repeat protein [Acidobacteriota bacterium]
MADALVAVLRRGLAHALREGQLDEAGALLERLQVEDPLSLETRGLELEVMLRSARLEEARYLAEQLLALYPASARIHYLAGRVAYQRRDYLSAQGAFAESLHIAPNWRTRLWLGKSLTQLGQLAAAEPILLELVAEHRQVRRDLAWLYERMGETSRALAELAAYLGDFPDDQFALAQQQRLRASSLGPETLRREIEALIELGEPVPEQLLPQYVETLLDEGALGRAREVVAGNTPRLSERATTRLAWVCHQHGAHDLAFELFTRAFAANRSNVKYLTALEADARRANRVSELISLYRAEAPGDRRLFSRARTLARRQARE